MAPLKRQGTSILSEEIEIKGAANNGPVSAKIYGARADLDLSGLWRRVWHLTNISLQRIDASLTPPATANSPEAVQESSPAATPHASKRNWYGALLPARTQIDCIQTDRANISLGNTQLRRTRIEARPLDEGWEINFVGGEIQTPTLPPLELGDARISVRRGVTFVRHAQLSAKTGGEIKLSGEIKRDGNADVHAHLENVVATPFLPAWWQERLRGALQGDLRYVRTSAGEGSLTGELRMTGGKLEALPLLAELDAFVGSPRFRQIPLKSASASLNWNSRRTDLSHIDLDADGILRVQGSLSIERGTLSGQLKMGIPPTLIQWLPGARSKVFTESRDGYIWAPMQLSGTVTQPVEDLSGRLAAAAVESVTETTRKIPQGVQQNLQQVVPEAAKGLLDAVKSILPNR